MRRLALIALAFIACAHQPEPLARPHFAPPKSGVFNEPLPVVENTDDDMMPALAVKTALIAYVSKQSDNLDIFVRAQESGTIRRLTTHSADDTDPAFSPSGTQIAWVSQADDVKGDIWLMNSDGNDKTRLTERDAAESAPAWSADGTALFFTTRTRDNGAPRIDALGIKDRKRSVVVNGGWDPAPAPDGSALVYVAPDAGGLPRLFAKRAHDNRIAAITDGAYIDALPRFAVLGGEPTVVFTRFVDDSSGDGKVDVNDAPSLWAVSWSADVFDDGQPHEARPLTPGAGGELLAAVAPNWIAYTAAGYADLEIYSLPADGAIDGTATADAVLEAARAEPDDGLRRLALRYLTATSPQLRGRARYELGRDLEHQGKVSEGRAAIARSIAELDGNPLQGVAKVELVRMGVKEALGGNFTMTTAPAANLITDARRDIDVIVGAYPGVHPVAVRADMTRAELELAEGHTAKALGAFESIAGASDVPGEDGARGLDHVSAIYAGFHDASAIERACGAMLTRFSTERVYVDRCVSVWVDAARDSAQADAAAALQDIVQRYTTVPAIAARAMYALGDEQRHGGYPDVAITTWTKLIGNYPSARAPVEDALIALGETAEAAGKPQTALHAYEQLLAQFGSDPRTRGRAKAGVTRISLAKADHEERDGMLAEARESYAHLLATRHDNALAHRRYIALSAKLGRLREVLSDTRAEAKAKPRDAIARYAYGYALTYATPLDLNAAEAEINATLDLDPRFAAGHLTLGWIRMQREHRDPGRDWLDRAESSFRTAQELVTVEDDPQLWAAAQLGRGNALLTLGKNDDAFTAYLARAGVQARFDDELTELLFYESFARAAWRMDQLDVALDMAHQEWLLAQRMPGMPRRATAAALQASILLQAELYDDAVTWYERAEALYRERKDWTRVVPMLRGKALAERNLGRDDDALDDFAALLELTRKGVGVPQPDKPFFGFLAPEIAANPLDVTRAPYGFSASQEEEVSRAAAARALRERSDVNEARSFADRRLALIDKAASDKAIAARIQPELLHALNESALLEVRAGDEMAAMKNWERAIAIAQENGYFAEGATILDAMAMMWARKPATRDDQVAARARAAAGAMATQARAQDAASAARLDRWLAIQRFAELMHGRAPDKPAGDLRAAIDTLDGMNGELDDIIKLAAGDASLSERLSSYAGGSTAKADNTAPLADFVGPPPPPTDAVASEPTASWRIAFDVAAAHTVAERSALDLQRLTPAIDAYLASGGGHDVPERRFFLDIAVKALVASGDVEKAWRMLERSRLEDLQPSARRLKGVQTQLATRPFLKRAIEVKPASLAEARAVIGSAGMLIQAFLMHDASWQWLVIDAKRIVQVRSKPMQGTAVPDEVAALIGEPSGIVYVDTGDLETPPTRQWTVNGKAFVSSAESLSATYALAAAEASSLARSPEVDIDVATLTVFRSTTKGHIVVRLRGKGDAEEPSRLVQGEVQLTFDKPAASPASETLDLDRIAATRVGAQVGWVDLVVSHRVARGIAQAFLFAGVPTTITSEPAATSISTGLAADGAAKLFAAAKDASDTARLIGYRGLQFDERVEAAYARLRTAIATATGSYKRALASKSHDDWQRANDGFGDVVDIVEFMREPAATEVLSKSTQDGAAALAKALPTRIIDVRGLLVQTMFGLGDLDGAAKLQETIVDAYVELGKPENAANALLTLGEAFMSANRNADAATVLSRCASLAKEKSLATVEADCRSRLGSAYRSQFAYEKASTEYNTALEIYQNLKHQNVVFPRRYLGLLAEGSLNDYDAALSIYQSALNDAVNVKLTSMLPVLNLDIARTYRARGDFALALEAVDKARATLTDKDTTNRAEAALEAAKIEWYRGDYPAALDEDAVALQLARASHNTFQEIQAVSLDGLIAMNQGDLDRAKESVGSALDLARGSGRKSEEAAQLDNLGNVLQRAGKLDDAEARFREALALDTQLSNTEGQAFDMRALAAVLERRGKYDESLATVDKALVSSRAIGSRFNETQCLYVKGRALLGAGKSAEASTAFVDASKLAVELSVPEVAWRASYAVGRIAESSGNPAKARVAYDDALGIAERLSRAGDDDSDEESRDTLYADAIRLAFAAGDTASAFRLIERMHARAVLDIVAAGDIIWPNAEAKELVANQRRAREAVDGAERELAKMPSEAGNVRLRIAMAANDQAVATLLARYRGVARAFVIAPMSLDDVQKLLPEDTALVAYVIGAKESDALVVKRGGVSRVVIAAKADDIATEANSYRAALRAFGSVDESAKALAAAVLAPVAEALSGVQHLVVVPHGPLVGIPFAALPWGDKQLVDAMTTSYAPSASALADQLERPRRQQLRTVLAAAHGDDLQFARLEALSISGAKALSGPDATETAVRALKADAVDIAAHGQTDGDSPMYASLALSQGASDDGRLELREVFGMEPLAPLVSLSACTLAGDSGRWRAVSAAFFASGTQTLIATQDRVSDLAAGVLMKRFYRQTGKSGSAALRDAQLWTRTYFAHPAHWATFALIGDFR